MSTRTDLRTCSDADFAKALLGAIVPARQADDADVWTCPHCGSTDIVGGYADVACESCGRIIASI